MVSVLKGCAQTLSNCLSHGCCYCGGADLHHPDQIAVRDQTDGQRESEEPLQHQMKSFRDTSLLSALFFVTVEALAFFFI